MHKNDKKKKEKKTWKIIFTALPSYHHLNIPILSTMGKKEWSMRKKEKKSFSSCSEDRRWVLDCRNTAKHEIHHAGRTELSLVRCEGSSSPNPELEIPPYIPQALAIMSIILNHLSFLGIMLFLFQFWGFCGVTKALSVYLLACLSVCHSVSLSASLSICYRVSLLSIIGLLHCKLKKG